ncbi:hypothetical protein BANRA_05148 [Escherichia coli]|nr:hypothetical protein BANRA_05148 [Escherichia coli]
MASKPNIDESQQPANAETARFISGAERLAVNQS